MKGFADRRKAALDDFTKEEIRKAASRVIAEHGFEKLTMSLVAKAAGVAKGTLYNYFKDKAGLLIHVVLRSQSHLLDEITETAGRDGSASEKLSRMALAILDAAVANRELLMMIGGGERFFAPAQTPEIQEMQTKVIDACTKVVERGMESGEFRRRDPVMVAQVFLYAVSGLIHQHMMNRATAPPKEGVNDLMSVLLEGIASD